MPKVISITRPDDWHVHFRDADALQHTVPGSAQHFARALIMPNLKPALTTMASIHAYRERILARVGTEHFVPYMTFYLNQQVCIDELHRSPFILGAKLYPAGATTHSEQGPQSIQALYPWLEIMQENDLVLQIHGEIAQGDVFEREEAFIANYLKPIVQNFPRLRIVLEHISTQAAVEFVTAGPTTLAATITPHHLRYNRNQLLASGIKPHYYCLPILKHERDQIAVQHAAISGNPKFFAGTDSAPHSVEHKESACGCAGIYNAPFAIAMYAEVFDKLNAIHNLDAFMGHFGADFYHLPRTTNQIELINEPQRIPDTLPFGSHHVVPVAAGSSLSWSIHEST